MTPFAFPGPVRTERLILRMPTEGDVDDVHQYQGRDDVCEFLPYTARTREEVASALAERSTATALEADGDNWRVLVELPPTDDRAARVIGEIYLAITSAEHLTGEIGWVLHPDFHGTGYAGEAASAALGLAFGPGGLHRMIARYDPRNAASIALCRRLGMREEAHFRQDVMFRGAWADTGISAILAEEWAARP